MKTYTVTRGALAVLLLAILAGCGQAAAPIIKTRDVEVTKYVREPIPAELLVDHVVAEPDPACWQAADPASGTPAGRQFCNGQNALMLEDYRAALRAEHADKASLRALNDAQKKYTTPPPPRAGSAGNRGATAPMPPAGAESRTGGKPAAMNSRGTSPIRLAPAATELCGVNGPDGSTAPARSPVRAMYSETAAA